MSNFVDVGYIGKMPRSIVYEVIDGERSYQDSLGAKAYGSPAQHSVPEYALYMQSYLADAIQVLSHTWGPEAERRGLDILRKVTALGVACMEQNGVVYREGTLKQPEPFPPSPAKPSGYMPENAAKAES